MQLKDLFLKQNLKYGGISVMIWGQLSVVNEVIWFLLSYNKCEDIYSKSKRGFFDRYFKHQFEMSSLSLHGR